MKLKISFIIILLFISGCSSKNFQPLNNDDIINETIFTGIAIFDGFQTANIREYEGAFEQNPFMSDNPNDDEILLYFTSAITAHWLINWWMPEKWRPYFQVGSIAIQTGVVYDNDQQGLSP